MIAFHLIAGAHDMSRLVLDDSDRLSLIRRLAAACGSRLLAYCVMDTHLHAVFEGTKDEASAAITGTIAQYRAGFASRYGCPLTMRGPAAILEITSAFELARTIRYDHRNPLDTKPPLADEDYEFPGAARAHSAPSRARRT